MDQRVLNQLPMDTERSCSSTESDQTMTLPECCMARLHCSRETLGSLSGVQSVGQENTPRTEVSNLSNLVMPENYSVLESMDTVATHNVTMDKVRTRSMRRTVPQEDAAFSFTPMTQDTTISEDIQALDLGDGGVAVDHNHCPETLRNRSVAESSSSIGGKRKRGSSSDLERPSKRMKVHSQSNTTDTVAQTQRQHRGRDRRSSEVIKKEFEDKYERLHRLGTGSFGTVYAGKRKEDNLSVAMKYIADDDCLDYLKYKGMTFPREVALMQALASPGEPGTSAAVSLVDWLHLDDELILVMERPDPCIDLCNYCLERGGNLKEEEAVVIVKQLLDATIELQSKNVFHRDIKLENLLLETSSEVPRLRLIDFGLGCFVRKGSRFRIFCGTALHVPPEWHEHSTYKPHPTTVWQVGVALFEMLHRREFETMKYIRKCIRIRSRLSDECKNFLHSCLSLDPEDRPTLQELRLHPWLNN